MQVEKPCHSGNKQTQYRGTPAQNEMYNPKFPYKSNEVTGAQMKFANPKQISNKVYRIFYNFPKLKGDRAAMLKNKTLFKRRNTWLNMKM